MSSLAGYNVGEEASEVKKNLFENTVHDSPPCFRCHYTYCGDHII